MKNITRLTVKENTILELKVPNDTEIVINNKKFIYKNNSLIKNIRKVEDFNVVWHNGCFYSKDEI